MSHVSEIVCFHCGRPVGDPPRMNRLPDGEPCTACAERLLETLPPIFHTPFAPILGVEPEELAAQGEDDFDPVEFEEDPDRGAPA